jgi:DNA (cytosine-5)-methyltransferase 1
MTNESITSDYYFVDLFCGAGGTSTGIVNHANIIACINHDKNAIASHSANHPNAVHFTEDIRTVALEPLIKMVADIRRKNPRAIICVWASLECTNHSNAKGGVSRDADSRTLAEHLFRYIEALNPDMVWIENVGEFKHWGPLRIKSIAHKNYSELLMTKPTKKKPEPEYIMIPDKEFKGQDYKRWVKEMESYGYNSSDILLNAADYGCETSRKRLFIQFAKPHIKISWPKPTHDKYGRHGLPTWKPVRPLLQLDVHGESIFERKKKLAPKTLERIYRGLEKFCKEPFIQKYYGHGDNTVSLDVPSPTLTTKDRLSVVQAQYLQYDYGNPVFRGVNQPAPTITTHAKESLVSCFMANEYSGGGQQSSLDSPAPTIMTVPKSKIVVAQFRYDYYNRDNNIGSLKDPCTSITCNPMQRVVTAQFMAHPNYNSRYMNKDLNDPACAITTNPMQRLVTVEQMITSHYSPGQTRSINEPCAALTTVPHESLVTIEKQFLQDHQFGNIGNSIDQPCPTLIAKMDKKPKYLITAQPGHGIPFKLDDTLEERKIKIFMRKHGITDVKMRGLFIPEMLLIMGFPAAYILVGTQTEQKKYIGNAVPCFLVEKMIENSVHKNKIAA